MGVLVPGPGPRTRTGGGPGPWPWSWDQDRWRSGADSLVGAPRDLQPQPALVGTLDLVLLDADQPVQGQAPVLGHRGVEVLRGRGDKTASDRGRGEGGGRYRVPRGTGQEHVPGRRVSGSVS